MGVTTSKVVEGKDAHCTVWTIQGSRNKRVCLFAFANGKSKGDYYTEASFFVRETEPKAMTEKRPHLCAAVDRPHGKDKEEV